MDSQHRRETPRRLTYQWRRMDLQILQERLRELPHLLRPRPITNRLWLDALFILILATLQLAIIPSIFRNILYVDLLTPWLVFIFVKQPGERSLILAAIAALTLETYTLAPAGLYFSLYPLMLATIVMVREPLSWRHGTPWAVTLALALAAIAVAEGLVHGIILGTVIWPATTYLSIIARVLISWVIGMTMVFHFLDREVQEEIS